MISPNSAYMFAEDRTSQSDSQHFCIDDIDKAWQGTLRKSKKKSQPVWGPKFEKKTVFLGHICRFNTIFIFSLEGD